MSPDTDQTSSAAPADGAAADDTEPIFRVVSGRPTDEELAAVLAVLTAAGPPTTTAAPAPQSRSGWSAYWRAVRQPLHPGPGAWRTSRR